MTTTIALIKREHAVAKTNLDRLRGTGERRQFDYWQGVYDALDNLLISLGAKVKR